MNGTEEPWLVGLFVFNPSPSPTPPPNNLQHRTEINTRSRGGGCCPRGATTTPPSHPTLGRVSRSPGGTVPAPQSCLGGKPQRALPSSRDRGGPWGSRVEAELGGLQVVSGGVTPAPGAAGSGLTALLSAQGLPCAPAPGTPGWEMKAVSGGKQGKTTGGRAALTPHPPA